MKQVTASAENVLLNFLKAKGKDRLWIFSDKNREWLAKAFLEAAVALDIRPFLKVLSWENRNNLGHLQQQINSLGKDDIILSVFSEETNLASQLSETFPPFSPPKGFAGRSCYIRTRIPDKVLVLMLADDISEIRVHAKKAMNLNGAKKLRVTAPGGTDLSFGVRQFRALPFIIERNCRHIFLPASEVFTAIMEGSAEGHIVVDLTVGEFVFEGEKWDHLGKVDEPVLLIVKGGVITSIKGGTIARRLDACLQRCDMKCRIIVELGIGLSKGFVTGCIGSDECLRGTCHFGIGDNKFYGGTNKAPVHLDVVIDCPTFEILE